MYKLQPILKTIIYLPRKFDQTSSDFTLEKLMEIKIQNFSEQISEISKKSTTELCIEKVKYFSKLNYTLN